MPRWEEVTGNNGDGPAKVGGTPTKNPKNPGCSFPPPTNKMAAYSSFGWDPSNLANGEKYNLKKLGPIDGWPGEFHLEPDDNHLAWRLAQTIRMLKRGLYTIEQDNSDNPIASKAKIAAQLDKECAILSAAGRPCTLKNNPEILGMLKKKPTYWILETGDGNGGTSLIQQAKASGMSPESLYVVHYGSPSAEVCKMLAGSHVIFSKSLDLTASNLVPCPDAKKGGSPMSPPPKAATPECGKEEEPKEDLADAQKPSAPYSGDDSGMTTNALGIGGGSGGGGSGGYPAQVAASREPEPIAKQNRVPVPKRNPGSGPSEKGLNLPESAVTTSDGRKKQSGNSKSFSNSGIEKLQGSFGAATGFGSSGSPSNSTSIDKTARNQKEGTDKASFKSGTSSSSRDATNFGNNLSGVPPVSLSPSEIASAIKSIEKEFQKSDSVPIVALEEGLSIGEDPESIFAHVHGCYKKLWLKGTIGR